MKWYSSQNSSSPVSANLIKGNIPNGMIGFDIGIETSQLYSSLISAKRAGTIFWNRPMELFEIGV